MGGARPEGVWTGIVRISAFAAIGEWLCSRRTGRLVSDGVSACAGTQHPAAKPGNIGQVAGAVKAGAVPYARAIIAIISAFIAQ